MEIAKQDRRIRKTKKALREGLAKLLSEKNIQNITVKELTDKADIHRSTFYANFHDIYDLYSHMEDTVIQEIKDIASVDFAFKTKIFFEKLLNYINDNKQVARLFFKQNISFSEQLTTLLRDACLDCWRKEYNIQSTPEEMDYYVQHALSGAIGIIGMWVSDDFKYPMEKLVVMLADIDSNFGKFISMV